ncbi:MAG: BolA family transcriptional regulator [Rhodocyclaceae bacterium]|jgi:BolA protein|nr:BolA family transcriptional regulator [Rhodocyclaceae bacterium]MBK6552506.1 BolA family transcriptional regulator [Rhodocyclaceae bacterium]MBK6675569.1 BolA family transcriptional regulator [Rhodocyclaceae bacterium]MBK7814254.1 BolA family transcriptional regulator [Rhodocyclaceae bacterium]MBK9312042.1 BolA family transcriptional regulator [Rhodocyclaceae bacterium]
MSTVATIKDRLATLQPSYLDVIDDSAQHAGHAGARDGGGHYRVHIVSERFAGLATMARHRLVYDALGTLMNGAIHALSITARTPAE